MKVTIHQPNFFPRLKILQKLASADIWVVMDNVQYANHEWQNRTKLIPINSHQNDFWLTACVTCPNGKITFIKDVILASDKFVSKTKQSLKSAFNKAPYYEQFEKYMENIYPYFSTQSLTELDVNITIELLKKTIGRVPKIIYASTLPVTGKKSSLVAAICEYVKADEYLCDSGGYRYLDVSVFSNTKIVWQKWQEPISKWNNIQAWRDISCINYLIREGEKKLIEHINSGEFLEKPDFYNES